ncbi:MAG TPA: hypothetical protein VFG07_00505 [Thermoplasmata archaeon]|nr:hypothetical protein [Thermoplasmata archaeon]
MALLREGGTRLYLPPTTVQHGPARRAPVFYNPGMAVDRDLEVALGLAWKAEGRRLRRVWEMTAATGVRGLRFLNETGLPAEMVLTESHPLAFPVLERNAQEYSEKGARAVRHDAAQPLEVGAFDLVDLDPYGSPAPFLTAALDALVPGGILAVTATDLRVLAGVEPGAAERRYGSVPLRGRLGPEGGLRILLAWLEAEMRKRGNAAEPLLAYVRDHHVRAYVRSVRAAGRPSPVGLLDPSTWSGPPLRASGPVGPLWLGPLLNPPTLEAMTTPPRAAHPRAVARLLERLQGELVADRPFYYESNTLAEDLRLDRPPAVEPLLKLLRAGGYTAARTHAREGGFRTTAPRARVEAAARALARP